MFDIIRKPNAPYATMALIGGDHILRAANGALAYANEHVCPVRFTFNDVPVEVRPGDTADGIVATFNYDCNERAEAWEKSEAGRRAAAEHAAEVAEMQALADRCWSSASKHLADYHATREHSILLAWLHTYLPCVGHAGVDAHLDGVVRVLLNAGYEPNANTDDAYNHADPDNTARYLIGQVLHMAMNTGSVHPLIRDWIGAWLDNGGVCPPRKD